MLEPSLGQSLIQDDSSANNVFLNLLFGKLYDEKVLQTQLNYLKWRPEDSYQLALAEVFTQDTQVQQQNDLDLLAQTIRQWAVHCIVMKLDSYILILSNRNLEENAKYTGTFPRSDAEEPDQNRMQSPLSGSGTHRITCIDRPRRPSPTAVFINRKQTSTLSSVVLSRTSWWIRHPSTTVCAPAFPALFLCGISGLPAMNCCRSSLKCYLDHESICLSDSHSDAHTQEYHPLPDPETTGYSWVQPGRFLYPGLLPHISARFWNCTNGRNRSQEERERPGNCFPGERMLLASKPERYHCIILRFMIAAFFYL